MMPLGPAVDGAVWYQRCPWPVGVRLHAGSWRIGSDCVSVTSIASVVKRLLTLYILFGLATLACGLAPDYAAFDGRTHCRWHLRRVLSALVTYHRG